MVTVPKAFSAASKARVIATRSVTSASIAVALPPWPSISSLSALSRSTRRATSATAAPLSASALANCLPSPLEAPVTSATRPERSKSSEAFMEIPAFPVVMPGFIPGIHDYISAIVKDVDGRDKPGHDEFVPRRIYHAARMRLTSGQLRAPKVAKSSAKAWGTIAGRPAGNSAAP